MHEIAPADVGSAVQAANTQRIAHTKQIGLLTNIDVVYRIETGTCINNKY